MHVLRVRDVIGVTGLSRSTVWRLERARTVSATNSPKWQQRRLAG